MELDALDRLAAEVFDGFIVRKDLVLRFKGQYPVPTYVAEFLLGRYCASVDEEEINEGLQIVDRQMQQRTVRAGEEELFKARARERGEVKIIDIIKASLNERADAYEVELPSLQLNQVRISPELVQDNERMLTGGFYAEIALTYDASIAQDFAQKSATLIQQLVATRGSSSADDPRRVEVSRGSGTTDCKAVPLCLSSCLLRGS